MAVACGSLAFALASPQVPGPPARSAPEATFYRDVLRILQAHCQECHRAQGIAPMAFETYEQTRPYAEAIHLATQSKAMPPWFADPSVGKFSNDPSLSGKEIATLANWSASQAPGGEQRDAPAARIWAAGWTIPEPDTVLAMSQAVALPASGDIDYTYEIVPTHFTEGRWVQMAEILPSQRANVHHAVVYVRPPDSAWLRHAPVGTPFTAASLADPQERAGAMWTDSDILLVYAPGSSPDNWPATMAKFIPAGSDLVFQMHYTSNGKAVRDSTKVGLRFSKEPPPQRVLTLQLTNDHFVIPPGAPDYRVEARGTLPNEATLLSFFPHMHLRGKRFAYNLIHHPAAVANQNMAPAESSDAASVEPLLRVNYHFHWQMSYRLAQPLHLPAGTELQAVAWFDNSRNNPHNPDPDSSVRWGEQTYDEMMVGFFDVAVDAKLDKRAFFVRH
jgi:mono/diheme cytochrome c family protein